eukprot:1136219-Pelagomonas_calceolata.AAC.6
MLDEKVSPAAGQPDSRAAGQPLVTLLLQLSCSYRQAGSDVVLPYLGVHAHPTPPRRLLLRVLRVLLFLWDDMFHS